MPNELPDMDELLRGSARSEREHSLQLGSVLIVAGAALTLATFSLFSGRVVFVAPAVIVAGVSLVVRGLQIKPG